MVMIMMMMMIMIMIMIMIMTMVMIMILIMVLILKFESTKKRLFCNFVNKYVEYVAVAVYSYSIATAL